MTKRGNILARRLLREVKRSQLALPGLVDESLIPVCEPQCEKAWHVVSVQAWCDQCGQHHVLEAMTLCVTISKGRESVLDMLSSMMRSMHDKLREGGTETETANGGESPVGFLNPDDSRFEPDPRSDEEME